MFAKHTWVKTRTAHQALKDENSVKLLSANPLAQCLLFNAVAVLAAALLFVTLLPISRLAEAQVQVVESQPTVRANDRNTYPQNRNPQATSPQQTANPAATNPIQPVLPITEVNPNTDTGGTAGDLYYQFQVMQQEVSELRGAVEELTNEVKKLKQQRLDDYVELDNRISGLTQQTGGAQVSRAEPGNVQSPVTSPTTTLGAVASDDERTHYQSAIQLLLDKKDYDGAIAAFNDHLVRFPGGQYEGNALFWLGQIYVIQQKNQQAIQSYSTLINKFPNHPKLWEAKFALGKVYFTLGDRAKAKALVQEVADSNSDVARLARNFLDDNLSS